MSDASADTGMPKGPRKKVPKELAVIYADHCTGCEACVEVCPVDCIVKIHPDPDAPGLQGWCEVDWDRCIGCRLCLRIPRKQAEPYELLVCPWEAIEMVPVESLPEAASRLGGPAEYAQAQRGGLLESARRQVDLARGGRLAAMRKPADT